MDDTAACALATDNPGHISIGAAIPANGAATFDVQDTGQNVALDRELMKADDTNRAFSLDMSIMRTFHRMLLHERQERRMIDPLRAATSIAGSGLDAQSLRLRIISENLANAQSTGATPGSDPYQRKVVTFASEFDRAMGASDVAVRSVGVDTAPFQVEHDPGNPAADANGNVKLPNVNVLIEMADMREANRGYEADLQMVKQARSMTMMMLDLLRNS